MIFLLSMAAYLLVYHYENLVMAEGYNAPGSLYWSLKTFLVS